MCVCYQLLSCPLGAEITSCLFVTQQLVSGKQKNRLLICSLLFLYLQSIVLGLQDSSKATEWQLNIPPTRHILMCKSGNKVTRVNCKVQFKIKADTLIRHMKGIIWIYQVAQKKYEKQTERTVCVCSDFCFYKDYHLH